MTNRQSNHPDDTADLLRRAGEGDAHALGELFARHEDRLQRVVALRLDRRMQGRLDAADVLQEAYLDFARRLGDYLANPVMPVYLWMRMITCRKLQALHRRHLGTKIRDAKQEVSIFRGPLPQASSVWLAAQLVGRLTSPSHAFVRAELQIRVQEALNLMEPIDREVLTLRHFEQLSNSETAQVLGISDAAASVRFVRALRRLKESLQSAPGVVEDWVEPYLPSTPPQGSPDSSGASS